MPRNMVRKRQMQKGSNKMMEVTQRTSGKNGIHGGQLLLTLQFVRRPFRLHAMGAKLLTPSSDNSSYVLSSAAALIEYPCGLPRASIKVGRSLRCGQLLLALQFVRRPSRLHATGAELSTPSSDDSSLSIHAASRERPAK